MSQSNVLIFGASARAAAFSALRAGWQPWCADLFADADLRARCAVERVCWEEYPRRFLDLLERAPPGPWLYVGGLENWPALVERMAGRRSLWGNGAQPLRQSRSPWFVTKLLQQAGIPCPEVKTPFAQRHLGGRWLTKQLRGAGGRGIEFFEGQPLRGSQTYLQEFIKGESYSGVFLGDGNATRLLGLTRQLVGESWAHAAPFHYCGSVGPVPLSNSARYQLERIGRVLADGCGLRGLFGVDFILKEESFWPIEVNPRYTASVEVLDYATGVSALALHGRAFDPNPVDSDRVNAVTTNSVSIVGKAILFAKSDLVLPASGPWSRTLESLRPINEMPAFADIPDACQNIRAGHPILTLLTRGESEAKCLTSLQQIAADLDRTLFTR